MSPVVLALLIFLGVLLTFLAVVATWLDLGARRDKNQS
jgi:hypothetical protein